MRGKLLVANPAMPDPNFDRTVVLLLEHNREGALGLILNRPTETQTDDVLPQWRSAVAAPPVVFVGGPVETERAIGLGRAGAGAAPAGMQPVTGGIGVVDPGVGAGNGIDRVRIFAGYAGWGEGQLEGEIDANGWFVVQASPDDILTDQPERLWRSVLRRQRPGLALLSGFPRDPSAN